MISGSQAGFLLVTSRVTVLSLNLVLKHDRDQFFFKKNNKPAQTYINSLKFKTFLWCLPVRREKWIS